VHPKSSHARAIPSNFLTRIEYTDYQADGPISLNPSATVFHYAQCLFEGLKAYRNKQGKISLFRPEQNMARMNRSADRIALPVFIFPYCIMYNEFIFARTQNFDGDALLECLKRLVWLEKDWIPQEEGYSMYIRPVLSKSYCATIFRCLMRHT
jgi:branched-chain amino acid aminotransferase